MTIDSSRSTDILPDTWEDLLQVRDRFLLTEIQAIGADLIWRRKELDSASGRVIVHYSVHVIFRGGREPLASSGPVNFRDRDRDAMILRLVRSVLNQAHAKIQSSRLAR